MQADKSKQLMKHISRTCTECGSGFSKMKLSLLPARKGVLHGLLGAPTLGLLSSRGTRSGLG
jgi:hypothetical protein